MAKRGSNRVIQIIILIIAVLLITVAILFLGRWTRSISEEKQKRELSSALKAIAEGQGVEAVLSLSGVQLADIFYGEEGVTILSGDESQWRYSSAEMLNITIYERVNKSVVHITTAEPSLGMSVDIQGSGSGIILSQDGYILTNAHVVEKASTLEVGLYSGEVYTASLIGLDSVEDLAVIKIEVPKGVSLEPVKLGDSSALKIGQKVKIGRASCRERV